jgi:GTP cyclohydrolase I
MLRLSVLNGRRILHLVKLTANVVDGDALHGEFDETGGQLFSASDYYKGLFKSVGEDPEREGLLKTPERAAKAFEFLTSGYSLDLDKIVNGAIFDEDAHDLVVVRDIEFYSLCEHHLLPFYGKVHIGYIPNGKIIGLSKAPRIVDMFARRLQVQERFTRQIADALSSVVEPKGIMVVVEGLHMCMMMRGVQKQNATMITRHYSGAFETDFELRSEFAHLIRGGSDLR